MPDRQNFIELHRSHDESTGDPIVVGKVPTTDGDGGFTYEDSGSITVEDEGTPLATAASTLDFVGAGVTASGTGAEKTITVPGLTVEDEGTPLATAATTLDFTGSGVTASGTGTEKTINIPGGAGITIQDEGSPLTTDATTLDFTGAGVTASGSGATKTINIPGGGVPDLSTLTLETSIQGVSDYVAGYDLSATQTRGFPVGFLRGSPQHSVIFDDCWYRANNASPSAYDGGVHENFANSGTVSTTTPLVNHPGVIALGTITSASSRSAILQVNPGDAIILAGGKARFGVVANLPTLSDGTNTFICRMGLGSLNAGDNDGIYFRYGSALNGGEWQGVCRSGGSEAGSVLDTNTAADTSWHRYEFEVNAAATSVEFFIDGTSKGTVSSNIVTAATRLAPASIVRSAGSASRSFLIDAYWLHLEFTTAR